ncbi:MAG: chitobiase/beta-hexosaminidase C-terminal domain-containing protein, partial [Phycisphaerae bacterium]|nr:chitobiase/beta-hexosaminidase C-terminal domain-containing protein [Phycisphaerae bacterium]
TDADRKLLGQVEWPAEPPAEGRKPAYTTETWDKPEQLVVWTRPGKSGQFEDPKSWLVNGERMKQWPRPTGQHFGFVFFSKDGVDFLFPASSKGYSVRPRRSNARARHITVEAGADAEIRLNNCTGNLWVSEHGSFNGGGGAQLGGDKHTFFINGRRYTGEPPTTAERFYELMDGAKKFARKWVVRKDDPKASTTLIGSFGSGDETHWHRGITILEENCVIAVGPRCDQTVNSGATMIMKSGSVLGKRGANQGYSNDMLVKGNLLVGTPDEPITRDVWLGISIKDTKGHLADSGRLAKRQYHNDANVRGLIVSPNGRIEVYTSNPADAKLHITFHGVKTGGSDDGFPREYWEGMPKADRTINVNFFGDQVLNDVVFNWVGEGDIRLANPEIRHKWQRIGFGGNNTAKGDALFEKIEPGEETKEQLARWRKEHEAGKHHGWGGVAAGQGARNPRILPSGGTFAAGDEVQVRLEALGDPEMRYTTDGSDSNKGQVYDKPLTLTETTTVKSGCFHHPGPHFVRQWGQVADTFTFVDETRAPDEPGKTEDGLALNVYDAENFDQLHAEPGEPIHSQTVDHFTLKVPEGRNKKQDGYLYIGYVEVDTLGIYRFYTRTEGASRLYIGDQLVVDNHRRYRYDWKPFAKAPLASWGSIELEPGKHAIRVEYLRGRRSGGRGFAWWKPQDNEPFEVSYEGPGVDKQPIPSDVLSH